MMMSPRHIPSPSPLHFAAAHRRIPALRFLVKIRQIPVDSRDDVNATPLHWAAGFGRTDAVRVLVRLGADLNARCTNGSTPLHMAAAANRVRVIRALVKLGSSVDAKNLSGFTPLHVAAMNGCDAAIQVLGRQFKSVDVNSRDVMGRTPLHLAALAGRTSAMLALASLGASLDARDVNGDTPLHAAVMSPIQFSQFSRFHRFSQNSEPGVHALLKLGARLDVRNHNGWLPVELSHAWNQDAIRILKAASSSSAWTSLNQEQPTKDAVVLVVACCMGRLDVVKTILLQNPELASGCSRLIHHGHSAATKNPCMIWSPVMSAISGGHLDVLEVLVNHGASLRPFGSGLPVLKAIVDLSLRKCRASLEILSWILQWAGKGVFGIDELVKTRTYLKKVKSTDVKSTDVKSTDVKSTDVKSTDVKSTDVKSTDLKAMHKLLDEAIAARMSTKPWSNRRGCSPRDDACAGPSR
jgi:ankyrin repeat protein